MTPDQPRFTEVTILTHLEAVEGLTDALLSAGAKGVTEERGPVNVQIVAYLPQGGDLEERVGAIRERLSALERQGLRIGPGTVGIRTLEAEAWSESWKDHFQILRVTPGLTIVPAWEEYEPSEGESVILLEPGPAFGTGGHPTTRLCLRALVQNLRPGGRAADVGCGSGILAVTAAVLGATRVTATDNDTTALMSARANASRNSVSGQIEFLDADLLPEQAGTFDVVVCNIVAEEVIRLSGRLFDLLSKGGRFIASGFVTASLPRIEDALVRGHLQVLETLSEENWAACVAERSTSAR
jgi:ribosomal protein L11 methyltransferase